MKEYKTATEQDLKKLLLEKREVLRNIRFGSAGAKVKNVKESRTIRKTIAQILTELNSRNK